MKSGRKLKLLLVDDHRLFREGIRASLVHFPSIMPVGEAANGKDALRKCKELRPDVVLMDLNMPEMSGLEATPLIREKFPNTKIIVLTVHDNKEYIFKILRAGAHGYLLKDTSPEELARAIESVAQGGAFFSPGVSNVLLEGFVRTADRQDTIQESELSEREHEVLRAIAQGKTTKEVATELNLSARTVETYRVRLKRKLNARNVAELLNHARKRQLL
jgi:two-component system, NarL family, nitrate/nitrite response regulator NarL